MVAFSQDEHKVIPVPLASPSFERENSVVSQSVIFKPLSYVFKETIGFDVKASFPSHPLSPLIR